MVYINEIWLNHERLNFTSRLLKAENFKDYVNGLFSEMRNRDKQSTHMGPSLPADVDFKVLRQTTDSIAGRFMNRNDNVIYLYARVWDDNPIFKLQEDEYYLWNLLLIIMILGKA